MAKDNKRPGYNPPLDDGGQAFPIFVSEAVLSLPRKKGMTLLDYFAKGEMQKHNGDDYKEIAKIAYNMAAAMVAERQRRFNNAKEKEKNKKS